VKIQDWDNADLAIIAITIQEAQNGLKSCTKQ
jgi:hypothetical protein